MHRIFLKKSPCSEHKPRLLYLPSLNIACFCHVIFQNRIFSRPIYKALFDCSPRHVPVLFHSNCSSQASLWCLLCLLFFKGARSIVFHARSYGDGCHFYGFMTGVVIRKRKRHYYQPLIGILNNSQMKH